MIVVSRHIEEEDGDGLALLVVVLLVAYQIQNRQELVFQPIILLPTH